MQLGELQALLGTGGFLKHKPAGIECEPHGHPVLRPVVDHQHIESRLGDDARTGPRPARKRLGREGHHGALIFV